MGAKSQICSSSAPRSAVDRMMSPSVQGFSVSAETCHWEAYVLSPMFIA